MRTRRAPRLAHVGSRQPLRKGVGGLLLMLAGLVAGCGYTEACMRGTMAEARAALRGLRLPAPKLVSVDRWCWWETAEGVAVEAHLSGPLDFLPTVLSLGMFVPLDRVYTIQVERVSWTAVRVRVQVVVRAQVLALYPLRYRSERYERMVLSAVRRRLEWVRRRAGPGTAGVGEAGGGD